MYKWVKNKFAFNLTYTAYKPKQGKEILFFSDSLKNLDFSLIKTRM